MVQNDNGGNNRNRQPSRRTEQTRWEAAEKEVGRLLTALLWDGYLILNDVPFPYGNLDHVVIRQDGVIFLIETKSHRGRVTWNGKQLQINKRCFATNPICQVNRSIRWIRHTTKQLFGRNLWIVSILVFPNADVLINRSVKRINVLNSNDLLGFIRAYRR